MYSNRGVPKFAGAAGPGGFRPRAAEGRETRLMVSNIHYEVSKDDLKVSHSLHALERSIN
jgi:hypothetical protein